MAALTRATSQAGVLAPAEATIPGENAPKSKKGPPIYSRAPLYPELPKGTIFGLASACNSVSYQKTAPKVLPLREISDRNQGTIRVHVFFQCLI